MAKEVGIKIRISSTGEEKVISNLQDLEQELDNLNNQLKTQDFGSKEFQETARNIQILKSQIEDVDKATEGLGLEKQLQATNSAVNVLVSSFQVLSGIYGIFISDNEDLQKIQEAEAVAVNVLNVALGLNNILVEANEAAQLRQIIASKANAIATRAAAIAQTIYNAALNANPIVFFTSAVVALTAAIYSLVKSYDENNDALEEQERIQKKIIDVERDLFAVRKKTSTELKVNLSLLTDNVEQRQLELRAIDDLKKTYPGFNAFIDENNNLTKRGIEFISRQIKLQELQAELNVLREKGLDLEIEQRKNLSDAIDDNNSFLGQLGNTFTGFFKGRFGQFSANIGNITDALQENQPEIEAVNRLYSEKQEEVEKLLEELEKYNKELEKGKKEEDDLSGGVKKANTALTLQTRILQSGNEAIRKFVEEYQKANDITLTTSADLLDKQDEVLDNQNRVLDTRINTFRSKRQTLVDELGTLFRDVIPGEDELASLEDGFKKLFLAIDESIKQEQLDILEPLTFEKILEDIESADGSKIFKGIVPEGELENFAKLIRAIPDESKDSFLLFFNGVRDRLKELANLSEVVDLDIKYDVEGALKISQVEDLLFEYRKDATKLGVSQIQQRKDEISLVSEILGITEKKQGIDENIERVREKIKTANEEDKQKTKDKLDEIVETTIKGADVSIKFYQGLIDVNEQADENLKQIRENFEKLGGKLGETTKKLSEEEIAGLREFFRANADEFDTLLEDIFNNIGKYQERLGVDGIQELFNGIIDGLGDLEGKSRDELEKIRSYLIIVGEEFATQFGLENNPFIVLLDKIDEKLKELPTKAEEQFSKLVSDLESLVSKITQVYSQLSSQLQDVLQRQTAILLSELQYREEATLKQIGDTTEREREEQLKVQREFAKKRFDLEKKAREQELRFALGQTIASGAEAVVRALGLAAPPPVPQLYAASVAGLTAVQVLTIRDQIRSAQSQVFIGRRGGMIQGGTHEEGGVPALLEGGEFVMSRPAVDKFGDIVGQLNQSVGGRGLQIDDSRIVQAISSQNTTKAPIKTYVLYNDIQNTDKLNKRIEKLSRL